MSNIEILIKMSKSKFKIYCKKIFLSLFIIVNNHSMFNLDKAEPICIFFPKFWNKNAFL